jgi:penicillin-binding protein 2
MDGHMVRPHVVTPEKVPQNYRDALKYEETKEIPIDPEGWTTITDAMSRVLLPEGTAPSAHVAGLEIAGKTGSAQTVSLALRAKYANKTEFAQNGWFVGFTPKRNPDVVVCVLFQGGEHGRLAARLATQVIKAYEDKKNHHPIEHLKPPTDEGAPSNNGPEEAPAASPQPKTAVVTGLWTDGGDGDHLQAARFSTQAPHRKFHRAVAAPGLEQYANSNTHEHTAAKTLVWRDAAGRVPHVVAAMPVPFRTSEVMGGQR